MFYVHYIFSYYNRPAPSNSTKWAKPKKYGMFFQQSPLRNEGYHMMALFSSLRRPFYHLAKATSLLSCYTWNLSVIFVRKYLFSKIYGSNRFSMDFSFLNTCLTLKNIKYVSSTCIYLHKDVRPKKELVSDRTPWIRYKIQKSFKTFQNQKMTLPKFFRCFSSTKNFSKVFWVPKSNTRLPTIVAGRIISENTFIMD